MQENFINKPQAIEAEQNIIGCMIIYPELVEDVLSQLRGSDFYDERNRILFEAIEALSNRKAFVDQTTLVDELKIENNL